MEPEIEGVSTQGAEGANDVSQGGALGADASGATSTETTVETPETPGTPEWFDQASDEELERFFKEHPKGQERASRLRQSEMDRAIALAKQGRLEELDPKLREFVRATQDQARQAGRQETEQEIQNRQYYERVTNFLDAKDDGDEEAVTLWRNMPKEERDQILAYKVDYERHQAATQVSPEKKAFDEAMQTAFTASLNALRKGLPEFSKLSEDEQEQIISDAFANSDHNYEAALVAVHAWEAEARAKAAAGSRIAAEAKRAAETSVAQELMEKIEDPETIRGGSPAGDGQSDDPKSLFAEYYRSKRS